MDETNNNVVGRRQRKAKSVCLQMFNDMFKSKKVTGPKMTKKTVKRKISLPKGSLSAGKGKKGAKKSVKFQGTLPVDLEYRLSTPSGSSGEEFVFPSTPAKKKKFTKRRNSSEKPSINMEESQKRLRSIIDSKISDDESGDSESECSGRMSGSFNRSFIRRRRVSGPEGLSQSQNTFRPTYLDDYYKRVKTWKKPDRKTQGTCDRNNNQPKNIMTDADDTDDDVVILD